MAKYKLDNDLISRMIVLFLLVCGILTIGSCTATRLIQDYRIVKYSGL